MHYRNNVRMCGGMKGSARQNPPVYWRTLAYRAVANNMARTATVKTLCHGPLCCRTQQPQHQPAVRSRSAQEAFNTQIMLNKGIWWRTRKPVDWRSRRAGRRWSTRETWMQGWTKTGRHKGDHEDNKDQKPNARTRQTLAGRYWGRQSKQHAMNQHRTMRGQSRYRPTTRCS